MRVLTPSDGAEIRRIIKTTMKDAGLTQVELARHLGFSEKHVSLMMQGKAGMSIPVLFAILDFAGLTLAIIPRPGWGVENRETPAGLEQGAQQDTTHTQSRLRWRQ